MAELWG